MKKRLKKKRYMNSIRKDLFNNILKFLLLIYKDSDNIIDKRSLNLLINKCSKKCIHALNNVFTNILNNYNHDYDYLSTFPLILSYMPTIFKNKYDVKMIFTLYLLFQIHFLKSVYIRKNGTIKKYLSYNTKFKRNFKTRMPNYGVYKPLYLLYGTFYNNSHSFKNSYKDNVYNNKREFLYSNINYTLFNKYIEFVNTEK